MSETTGRALHGDGVPGRRGDEDWNLLNDAYKRKGIVLALGAGVSAASGIPNWTELMRRLVEDSVGQPDDGLFDRLTNEHRLSLPVLASILQERSSDRQAFVRQVREALYRGFKYEGGVHDRSQFVDEMKTNTTLHAVGTLCAVRAQQTKTHGAETFVANPRVGAVVTFNLDALLQTYVRYRFLENFVRTVERASASPHLQRDVQGSGFPPRMINIYHMHGFLRFDEKAEISTKEGADKVTLTEQDYFDFYNKPTSLFNYAFLHLLRESPFLFVGLSMQDENIRRLLHYSKTERIESLKSADKDLSDAQAREGARRHFAILKHTDVDEVDRALEESLRPLGTRVLWVDGFEAIPLRLRAMYDGAGGDWESVP